jgi:prephenate dehydrogenase
MSLATVSEGAQHSQPRIRTLAVIGVGLIGGSFAAACRKAGIVDRVIGAGRRPETLSQAVAIGLIDEAVTLEAAAKQADLIFIAAPVGAFESIFTALAPGLNASALITDGGSTKQNVIEAARRGLKDRISQFVPAHPMAGSHEKGPQAADAGLYVGRRVILTPLAENREQDVLHIQAIWEACGARVVRLEPAQHDGMVAAVSHLPHWVAALYMQHILSSVDTALKLQTAGTGFKDFTRVAQGSPEMWTDIFMANREAMLHELKDFRQILDRAEQALESGDEKWLTTMLEVAAKARAEWPGTQS